MGKSGAKWEAVAGGNSLGGGAVGPGRAGCIVCHLQLSTLPWEGQSLCLVPIHSKQGHILHALSMGFCGQCGRPRVSCVSQVVGISTVTAHTGKILVLEAAPEHTPGEPAGPRRALHTSQVWGQDPNLAALEFTA